MDREAILKKTRKPDRHARHWTDREDTFIVEHYESMSDDEIGQRLGRTGVAVMRRRLDLGYAKQTKNAEGKREAILAFVTEFIAEHGYAPTFREIKDATSISSTSVVAYHLDALEGTGDIERNYCDSRTIRVLGGPQVIAKIDGPNDAGWSWLKLTMRHSKAPDSWVARPDKERTYSMGSFPVRIEDLDTVTAALRQIGWLEKEEAA